MFLQKIFHRRHFIYLIEKKNLGRAQYTVAVKGELLYY